MAGALAMAEAAVLLLRPRRGLIDPVPVGPSSYFSAAEVDRARRFRRPQTALALAGAGMRAAALAALASHPPRRFPGHPVAAGAALAGALTAAGLPLGAVARVRARRVGLDTRSWAGWAADVGRATAIGSAFAAAGSGAAMALARRAPRGWWLPASALAVGAAAGIAFAGPVLLDPIFNRFEPLPAGPARDDVLELAVRAGVEVGEVYVMDASRRTTAANAYVTGLGRTKRVVLFDTLLEAFTRDETRLVVAHELAHVRHRDVPRGLAHLALVAPAALLAVARLEPRTVPQLWLAAGAVAAPLGWISNQLSRRVEARADAFALRLTDAPEAFVSFERRIVLRNVAEPRPPRIAHLLLGTHPTTMERIGIAEAYEAGAR